MIGIVLGIVFQILWLLWPLVLWLACGASLVLTAWLRDEHITKTSVKLALLLGPIPYILRIVVWIMDCFGLSLGNAIVQAKKLAAYKEKAQTAVRNKATDCKNTAVSYKDKAKSTAVSYRDQALDLKDRAVTYLKSVFSKKGGQKGQDKDGAEGTNKEDSK